MHFMRPWLCALATYHFLTSRLNSKWRRKFRPESKHFKTSWTRFYNSAKFMKMSKMTYYCSSTASLFKMQSPLTPRWISWSNAEPTHIALRIAKKARRYWKQTTLARLELTQVLKMAISSPQIRMIYSWMKYLPPSVTMIHLMWLSI